MNKKKIIEKEPIRLWFSYTSSAYGGEALSEEPYADRADEHREVSFHGCYNAGPDGLNFDSTSVEVSKEVFEAKKVYLVVVRYEDGDTFGRSYGNWHIVDVVLTEEEARDIDSGIRSKTYTDKCGYNCWEGYFNRLESVEIHEFPVLGKMPGEDKPVWSSVIKH